MLFLLRIRNSLLTYGGILLLVIGLLPLSGCRADLSMITIMVASDLPAGASVPSGLRRLAIAHPAQVPHDLLPAYAFLETESRRLTSIRAPRPDWSLAGRSSSLAWQAEREDMISPDRIVESSGLIDAEALLFFQIDAPHLTERIGLPFSGQLPPVTVATTMALIGSEEEFFHDVVSVIVKDSVLYATEQELAGLYSHLVQFAIRQTLSDLSQAFLVSTDSITARMTRDQPMLAVSPEKGERSVVP